MQLEIRTERGRVQLVALVTIAVMVLGLGTLALFTGGGWWVYLILSGMAVAGWGLLGLMNKVAAWIGRGE